MVLGAVPRGPSQRWLHGPSWGAALGVGAAPVGGPVWGAPNDYLWLRPPGRRGTGRPDRWGMSKGDSRRTCNCYKGVGAMIGRRGAGQRPTQASVWPRRGCGVGRLDYLLGGWARGVRKGVRLPPQRA